MSNRVGGISLRVMVILAGLMGGVTGFSHPGLAAYPGAEADLNAAAAALDPDDQGGVTLRLALQRVLQRNPELAAFSKEVRAFEGSKLQAGLFKNPEFNIEAEDVSSSNAALQRFATFRISQLIELGGKRHARVNVAVTGQALADQAYAAKRLEMIARTANAFIGVLEGQAQVSVVEDTLRLAEAAMQAAVKRVDLGQAPPMEAMRSKVALATVRIELEQAKRDLAAARTQLALLWGDTEPRFNRALGELEALVEIPSFDQLAGYLEQNPLILQSSQQIVQRQAMVELEKAHRIPDITLGAGVRRYLETDNTTALLDISIPIPVFDRNQGNLLEARQRLHKAMDERLAVELQLKTEFARTYENLLAAQNEIRVLRDEVLPSAQQAFELTNRGYQLGRFGFLEMLDAQRTFFQSRTLYVRALANYQRLINTVEQLVAAPIDSLRDAAANDRKQAD